MDQIYNLIPHALYIGIKLHEFWELNPQELNWYSKSFQIRETFIQDIVWLVGAYTQNAVASCLSKNVKYPKKPSDIIKEQELLDDDGFMSSETMYNRISEYFNQFQTEGGI